MNISKLKLRKLNFLALFVLVLLFSMPKLIYAQGFDGFVGFVQNQDRNWFYYNVYDIKIEKTPIHFITVPFLYLDRNKNFKKNIYKINCETKEIWVDDKFVVDKNIDSVGNRMVRSLCGFKQENATWVHYFTFPVNSEGIGLTLFINIERLENVSIVVNGVQKEGISVDYTNGHIGKDFFQTSDIRNLVMSCSEENFFDKDKDSYVTISVDNHFGSGIKGLRHNLCSGVYANLVKPNLSAPLVLPKIPSQVVTPKQLSPINNAKAKCIELGFKSGTEELGKCVLQLSK